MTTNFPEFAKLVAESFQYITSCDNAFVMDVDGDALYKAYLEAFPKGTNPMFKTNTEHDCNCCKGFVRRVGNVAIVNSDGSVITVWDRAVAKAPAPYKEVAKVLQAIVADAPVLDIFRTSEGSFGAEKTLSQNEAGDVLTWNHFYTGRISERFRPAKPDEVRDTLRERAHETLRMLKQDHGIEMGGWR
jgi:hypothetical protein